MPGAVFLKLFAIFATIAIGWCAGRMRPFAGGEAARIVSNAAFYLFAPALLFRTTARIDLAALPWRALAAFFVPVVAWLLLVYAWERRGARDAARPAVRAVAASYGNNAQLGIPVAAALVPVAGLQLHLSLVSLHALILLTLLTALAESDLARSAARGGGSRLARTLALTAKNSVIHPVVLPVLAGLGWNALGWPLPAPLDELLLLLGAALVPVSLIAIGLSLGHHGLGGAAGSALRLALAKLLLLPALVLLAARFGARLSGLPLTVIVMAAAMPIGVNALLFAQRYRTGEAEISAAVVLSTLLFALGAPLWLLVLARLA
jgi:predicted permease